MSIIIDPEFKSLIPPLSDDEFRQLEENCVRDGIRDPLITWPQGDGNEILIDGHNRWDISVKHAGIPFQIKRMEFHSRDDAKSWIIKNQLGRRNIDTWVKYDLAQALESLEKEKAKERQGTRSDIVPTLAQSETGKVRDKMAALIGVSHGTYDKMKRIEEKATDRTKQLVREGHLSINQAYNSTFPKRPDPVKKAGDINLDKLQRQQRELEITTVAAQCRLGELAHDMEQASHDRGNQYTGGKVQASDSAKIKKKSLKTVGITKQRASEYERMAAHPKVVERIIESGEHVTKAAILNAIRSEGTTLEYCVPTENPPRDSHTPGRVH